MAGTVSFVAAACSGPTPTDIEGGDTHALQLPSLRVVWNDKADPESSPQRGPGEVSGTLRLEVDRASGRFEQELDPGQAPVEFGGTSFPAPARIDCNVDLTTVEATADAGLRLGSQGRAGFIAGLGVEHLRLDLESGTIHDDGTLTSIGLIAGLSLGWEPLPLGGLYADGTMYWGLANGENVKTTRIEAGCSFTPIPPVPGLRLFAAWRRIHYLQDRAASDLDIELSGPVLGVEWRY